MFDVNRKINSSNNAKYLKFHCQKVESSEEKANLGDYPGDTVQNLESPGLQGRVDSAAHYYLVYKLKTNLFVSLTHCEREG